MTLLKWKTNLFHQIQLSTQIKIPLGESHLVSEIMLFLTTIIHFITGTLTTHLTTAPIGITTAFLNIIIMDIMVILDFQATYTITIHGSIDTISDIHFI